MKKIINLVKLQLQLYFKGSLFIMPLIVTAVFLYTMYSVQPLSVTSSYLLSGTFLFLLMTWIGLTTASGENEVTEQVLVLRVQNRGSYYAGKVIFLMCIAFLTDLLCTIFPVVQNMLNSYRLFDRQLLVSDVINAFLLQYGCAFAGAGLGSFLHPRVMKDRKLAIILTVLLAALTIAGPSLGTYLPAAKAFLWVLPPVMLPAQIYGNSEYFIWGQTFLIFFLLIFYGTVFSILKSLLCHRNKF